MNTPTEANWIIFDRDDHSSYPFDGSSVIVKTRDHLLHPSFFTEESNFCGYNLEDVIAWKKFESVIPE